MKLEQHSGPVSERLLAERVIALMQSSCSSWASDKTIEEIVEHFGLTIQPGYLPPGKDGAYVESRKVIILNKEVSSIERRNFTCYHELVHFLIRQEDSLYSYIHETYKEEAQFEAIIERLCNIGAAELIIPQEQVRRLIDTEGFVLEHLPTICSDSPVSGPASLIQLVQCAPHRCYGVVCDYGYPPICSDGGQDTFVQHPNAPELYILYATWSLSARYSISRFTIIPSDHLLFQAFSEQEHIKGIERIPFRSRKVWKVDSEAMFFRGKCYGIFNVDDPPNPNQPSLF